MRVQFSKGDAVRFISHLELMKTFHRAVRRANIPVAFSQGYNPHPRTSFGPPLSVGFTGLCEYADFVLDADMNPGEFTRRLNSVLPSGLEVLAAREIEENAPALSAVINTAIYRVILLTRKQIPEKMIREAVENLLSSDRIMVQKRRKDKITQVDIRPFIFEIKVIELVSERLVLKMVLALSGSGSVNPVLVVEALKAWTMLDDSIIVDRVQRDGVYVGKGGELSQP